MKTYLHYKTEDFAQDPYFRKWALGQLLPEDRFWETWQTTHPEQYLILEKAKSMVIALQIDAVPASPEEINQAIDRILAETAVQPVVPFYKKYFPAIAASVSVLLAIAYLGWHYRPSQATIKHPVVASIAENQEINNGNTHRKITLPDGSEVLLEGHSSLRIGRAFGDGKREVYLTGEAFFNVTKNPEQPFLVYSGKVITKVLGTSFRIKAYDADANVSIGVRSGKVTVFRQPARERANPLLSEEVILMPNQQAIFDKKEERFVKTLVEKPAELTRAHLRERLDFNETSIPLVLNTLEQVYGLKIIYDTDRLKGCNLTGSLNEGTLYDKLTIVCETIQASYKIMDGQVVIYGKGCK